MDPTELARDYYRHVDTGEYDALAGILAPEFVHVRPDRTIEGRDRFVRFMREERPDPDTEHDLVTVFGGGGRVAVEGRLFRQSGERLFGFVDTFDVVGDRIQRIRTYTD
jgi:ketosteroid isomerase-like protein